MIAPFILFVFSGIGLGLILLIKIIQERTGYLLFWPYARSRIEQSLNKKRQSLSELEKAATKQGGYALWYNLIPLMQSFFRNAQKRLDQKSFKLRDIVRGKKQITQSEQSSHFLRDIRKFKDTFKE